MDGRELSETASGAFPLEMANANTAIAGNADAKASHSQPFKESFSLIALPSRTDAERVARRNFGAINAN